MCGRRFGRTNTCIELNCVFFFRARVRIIPARLVNKRDRRVAARLRRCVNRVNRYIARTSRGNRSSIGRGNYRNDAGAGVDDASSRDARFRKLFAADTSIAEHDYGYV